MITENYSSSSSEILKKLFESFYFYQFSYLFSHIHMHGHLIDCGRNGNDEYPALSTLAEFPAHPDRLNILQRYPPLLNPEMKGPPTRLIQVFVLPTPMQDFFPGCLQTLIVPPPCHGGHQANDPARAKTKIKTQTSKRFIKIFFFENF